ncbi:MAG: PLP-dependent aminotransferase family protein [Parvibaculaceae bacterium]
MAGGAFRSLAIDRQSRTPAFVQIYKHLRHAIASGRIDRATRLPSTRSFARELGVSRTTVIVAYEHLIADGYAEGRRGSAVFACGIGADARISREEPNDVTLPREQEPVRIFCPETPDMALFPHKTWARAVATSARRRPSAPAAAPLFGDVSLRERVARHLYELHDLPVSPAQVVITSGPGDAFNCILRAMTRAGDRIALERPGPVQLHNHALALGLVPAWLDSVGDGVGLPPLAGPVPVLTVISPAHHFPIGGTMPLDRRRQFLQRAQETSGWIVEDNSNSEFQYEGSPLPPLAGLSRLERVIHIGSFSRVFSQGLRLGYLVVPSPLIGRFAASILAFDQAAPLIQQHPLAMMMNDGSFDQFLRHLRTTYAGRRSRFLARLKDVIGPMAEILDSNAGTEISLRLPAHLRDHAVVEAANKRGLFCRALSSYCPAPPPTSGLVLGCCGAPQLPVDDGLAILRDILGSRI